MRGATSPAARSPAARAFLIVAVICGVAVVIAVLLWMSDVITLPVLIGVIAVTAVVEIGAVIVLQRRASRHQARAHEQTTRGATSTLDADSPHTRFGYDPMAGRDPRTGQDPAAGRDGDTRP